MLRVRPRAAKRMKKATDPGMIALGIGIAVLLAFSLMIVLFVFPDDKKTGAGNDDNTEVALLESESLMAENGEENAPDIEAAGTRSGKKEVQRVKPIRYYDVYIACGGEEDVTYLFKGLKEIEFEEDENGLVSVSGNKIKGVKKGETELTVRTSTIDIKLSVLVTDAISKRGDDFDYTKPFLKPGLFTKEDNDLLDEILKSRVNRAGYMSRAGVVEAARFLALEFPYRIGYFNENGRLANPPKVDGEGRYYHKGLYLHSSRFETLDEQYIMYGPNPWGYTIYSDVVEYDQVNGLDCSGFVAWAMVQAGYDPGDMGAGIAPGREDFTDLGEKEHLTDELLDKLKVGDLLSGDGATTNAYDGGHIAILIGIKDGYYYVAETLWGTPRTAEGLVAMKYTPEELEYYFYWWIPMNEYYGEDGNLTDFWN